jgi:hypothetical protein
LSKVLGDVLEFTSLEGSGTTPEMWVFMRRFTARVTESQNNIVTLIKRSVNAILSDMSATVAKTSQAEEVLEAVSKVKQELDRLRPSTAEKTP